jgi:hypothetical protein
MVSAGSKKKRVFGASPRTFQLDRRESPSSEGLRESNVTGETMKKLLCALALFGMMAVPGLVGAQTVVGPQAAFHDDVDFGVGGFVSIPVPSLDPNLSIVPSFMYYFPDGNFDYWELNGDVVYNFEVSDETPVLPFAFGGLNIARVSGPSVTVGQVTIDNDQTEIGLNLGGGITFRAESVRPFVGAKFQIGDIDGFVVFGGVGFPVGS